MESYRSQSLPAQPQPLSPQDLETLIDTFPSTLDPLRSLNLLLHNLPRLPSTLRPSFLLLLTDLPHLLYSSLPLDLSPLALRFLLLSLPSLPTNPSLPSATSLAISLDARLHAPQELSLLVEHLLSTAVSSARSNSHFDRPSRALACECLRELELAFPLLLSSVSAHLWSICQLERTHVAQHYTLLLATVVLNILRSDPPPGSIFVNPSPLKPFKDPGPSSPPGGGGEEGLRDVRKVVAFLIDRPQLLTPAAIAELAPMVVGIVDAIAAAAEGLRVSVAALVKVNFFWLIHTYNPLLCHVALVMRLRFPDAFAPADDHRIVLRLAGLASEPQQPLSFRLLALHWLLGMASSPRPPDSEEPRLLLAPIASRFYPSVYDPLALKAAKLDVLARVAAFRGTPGAVKLLEDGLVCVSAFKWLPTDSMETTVAFRTFRRFLLGAVSACSESGGPPRIGEVVESAVFRALQSMLVDLALQYRRLVPVIAAFVDHLMECRIHRRVGERLLQRMDEYLLPKLVLCYSLSRYFPLFERISRNESIPPRRLLELLTKYMAFLAEKHGPDTSTRSWSQGSKVLSICRTMLVHHHSSRVFQPLSQLLAFACEFFPDLDVRDSARICLRMLLCIPGRKLRHILNIRDQVLGVSSSSPHPSSFFQVPSLHPSQSLKKATGISSYIHLERVNPLLVKQSWSLAIMPILDIETVRASSFEGIKDANIPDRNVGMRESAEGGDRNGSFEETSHGMDSTTKQESSGGGDRIGFSKEPLRVADSRVAEILEVLRKHFVCIPDYRHMPGIKIRIPCTLRFDSEPFSRAWEVDLPARDSDGLDKLPALYACVIKFSSASKYGSIPSCRVPFLLGEPPGTGLSIVPVEDVLHRKSRFRSLVIVELEPQEPVPGFVNVIIEANGGNGQIILGPLQDITVGIEDMFLKAHVPLDIPEDCVADYFLDLFNALWEACGDPANVGRETFLLKGGRGVADISGTKSVKLLEVPASYLISSIERHLVPFVVGVSGSSLINLVRNEGIIKDVVWKEDSCDPSSTGDNALVPYSGGSPLQLTYYEEASDADSDSHNKKTNMGCFYLLFFLPPRFHLLLQLEVCNSSTLVRIRTDHWPCLAYVDEYLETLFSDGRIHGV